MKYPPQDNTGASEKNKLVATKPQLNTKPSQKQPQTRSVVPPRKSAPKQSTNKKGSADVQAKLDQPLIIVNIPPYSQVCWYNGSVRTIINDKATEPWHELHPLRKERLAPGEPERLRGTDPPKDLFPLTLGDLQKMTAQQISALSKFYVNDFNIRRSDKLKVKRRKFLHYISFTE